MPILQNSFHPELQAAIEDLKKEIAKENWEQKGKFPPALKPHLSTLALLAIKLDEYDDHFFNLMPTLFPYNKFTMTVGFPLPSRCSVHSSRYLETHQADGVPGTRGPASTTTG
jgi:Ubinuclein conserved middle domain